MKQGESTPLCSLALLTYIQPLCFCARALRLPLLPGAAVPLVSRSLAPLVPYRAVPQLRAEVKSIDNKLTTTSMKLAEEKVLLRRKNSIKARLKELVGFEAFLQEVQALKVGG